MWIFRYISFGLLMVCAAGFNGLQELDVFEELQNAVSRSSSAKLTKCGEAVGKINLKKDWTVSMFDSTSKLQSGILAGSIYELGSFDECLAIDDAADEVKGKYCLGTLTISNSPALSQLYGTHLKHNETVRSAAGGVNVAVRWAICVPDACTADDLNDILEDLKIWSFNEIDCQTVATQQTLETGDICAIVFLGIIGFIMLLSTLYDISLHYKEKETSHPSLLAFSVFTNGRKLFQVVDNPKNLQCVAGLRSISMMWVVIGHLYPMYSMVPNVNLTDMVEWYLSPKSMFIVGATVSVDTFFLLGGMVMVYVYLGTKSDFKFSDIPAYYLHRYLRLTPVLAVVLLINATILENLASGPLWSSQTNQVAVEYCEEYWWSTLLYIQNYVNIDKMCVGVSWYLCIDMQLFVLSPLILIPLKKYTKATLGAVVFLTCASIASAVYVSWYYKLNGFSAGTEDPMYFNKYYVVLWTRAAPWLIGLILGYYVHQVKNLRSIKLNKLLVVFLWIASLTILCVCLFCGHDVIVKEDVNLATSTMYTALVRPTWAIALSWVVFACISGYGGPVNAFLSLPIFQIIARVSYCIYLTHNMVLAVGFLSTRVPLRFTDLNVMVSFWSYFMVTFFISVVFTLAFESPIIIIEKSIKNRGKPKLPENAKVGPQV